MTVEQGRAAPERAAQEANDGNLRWSRDVTRHWRWLLALLALGCATAGWLATLYDPDLPMHLRVGEWIVTHGRVPFAEPFAWTRAGAPYYAYSWLAQVAYYALFATAGEHGLHALHALVAAASFLVIVWLGRLARWTPWATLLVALLSFAVWIAFLAAVRPQVLMAVTLPLSWIGAELLAQRRARSGAAIALLAAVLTANTHVLFPLTIAPIVRLLAAERIEWRAVTLFVGANVVGWMLTPYLLVLPSMMALNLSDNALVGAATSVSELEPGFRALLRAEFSLRIAALILLVTPVFVPPSSLTTRERIWYGLSWCAGLVLFALALRGILLWLPLALPLLARLAAAIPLPTLAVNRRVTAAATLLIPLSLAGGHWRAGDEVAVVTANLATRQLPVAPSSPLEPLVRWLECRVASPDSARVFTYFNYGSYLTWRAPFLRYSIDSRGIFPDSVARPEAFQLALDGPMQFGPWRSADLAIVPVRHAVARQLDDDSAWTRVRTSVPSDTTLLPAALWVRNAWYAVHATAPLSSGDSVRAERVVPVPGACPP